MENRNNFAFGKKNYLIMFAGIVVIGIGFLIMTMDKEAYGLGFMGITLGPIVALAGFGIEFFAIFYKEKSPVMPEPGNPKQAFTTEQPSAFAFKDKSQL